MLSYPSITEKFYSPFSPAQVLERLQRSIQSKLLRGIFHQESFRGDVMANTFHIRRRTSNRRAHPPHLTGRVDAASNGEGSDIMVQFRDTDDALAGSIIMALALTGYASYTVYSGIQESRFSLLTMMIPPIALMVIVAVQFASFRYQVWRSRRKLQNILLLEKAEAI